MDSSLSSCTPSVPMRRRRKQHPSRPEADNRFLCLRRPHSLLAVLLVVDRYSVASAFGGLRVGVASGSRFGSADGEGLQQLLGDWARRVLLQPRCATLAPTTDAGEGQALSSDSRPNRDGRYDERSRRTPETIDVVREPQGNARRPPFPAVAPRCGGGTESATDCNPSVLTLETLNSRDVDPARVRQSVLHHLRAARRLTSYQYASLGMASSRYCDIHLVMEVCETARSVGITTNVRFMTNLVNAAAKKRRWVMAAQLLQLMRSYGVEPNDVTFTSILSEMSKAKQHHMAVEMMQTENLRGSLDAYNALISGCASCRGYERAIGYYNEMIKAGVQPDAMTFSSLIATTRDGTDTGVERGFAVREMMKMAGIQPSTYCMNSLMAVSVKARQPNTALEIFQEMKTDGIPRDVVSYNTAIWACDKLGDSGGALRLLREARQSSIMPDDFSYNSVISALGHSSLWQEAIQIFEEMGEVGVLPGLMTYNTLIAGCVRAEHPQEALSVFNLMEERNIRRDQYSYAGALHACMQLRDFELSMSLLDKMEMDGMPANAMGYATAIRTCARCGKSFEAMLLYVQSLKLGIVPTKVTYKALLEAFAEVKSAEQAVWVLDEMEDMKVEIEHQHLRDVLAACTTQTDIALRVLRLNTDLNLHVASQMYARGLEVCISAGDYEVSLAVVELMSQVGLQPEPEQEKRMLQACFNPPWPAESSTRRRSCPSPEEIEDTREGQSSEPQQNL